MSKSPSPLPLIGALLTSACTWVEVSDQAAAIEVVASDQVTLCEHIGTVTSTVLASMAGISRNEEKVSKELDDLARERALKLNANTLVRKSSSTGEATYIAYQCPKSIPQ